MHSNSKLQQLLEVIRFGLVGGLATLVHLGSALFLLEYLKATIVAANLTGFLIAVLVSYFGHQRFTFRRSGNFSKFAITTGAGLLANLAVSTVLRQFGSSAILSLTFGVAAAPVVVFILSKFWAYKGNPT